MTKRLSPTMLLLLLLVLCTQASAGARLTIQGEVVTWRGAALVMPADDWTINSGPQALVLYGGLRREPGFVVGSLELVAPDAPLAEALAERDEAVGLVEELARFLADVCRELYGDADHLRRFDSAGAVPAVQLSFAADGDHVRAVIYAPPGDGLYLLRLSCKLGEQRLVENELDALLGEVSFNAPQGW